ncbi:glycosyltransferase [Acinetobacter sp. ANC 4862]|uniref:glycosyltransferase n=1 Tax=Acinetobacter sp. ANC 4862 TaxID=2529849 RepID=UPI00103C14A5|nr:glycosyltransferase [Acinetobacter sp. ANC 4862]TCH64084.1 glycosyltransferase [Acinetobacter sp. ANC 4862]
MKVIFLVHSFDTIERGGVLKVVSELTESLVSHIDDINVISLGVVNSFAFDLNDSVKFSSLDMPKYKTTFYKGNMKVKWFFDAFNALKESVVNNSEAIWVTSSPPLTLLLGLFKFKYNLKVIGCDHISTLYSKGGYVQKIRNLILKKINIMVALTPQDRDFYIQNNIRSVYIPNGVNLDLIHVNNARKNIIFVGRFHDVKQPLKVVDLFVNSKFARERFRLKMYGHGELEEKLISHVNSSGFSHLIDIITDETNPNIIYKDAFALVMTSKVEGMPMVLLEAISKNIPCLAIDCPYGPANIIKDAINGFLINGEYDDFEKKIASCEKLINTDFRDSISEFSNDNVTLNWMKLLNEV